MLGPGRAERWPWARRAAAPGPGRSELWPHDGGRRGTRGGRSLPRREGEGRGDAGRLTVGGRWQWWRSGEGARRSSEAGGVEAWEKREEGWWFSTREMNRAWAVDEKWGTSVLASGANPRGGDDRMACARAGRGRGRPSGWAAWGGQDCWATRGREQAAAPLLGRAQGEQASTEPRREGRDAGFLLFYYFLFFIPFIYI
jgi:hypothetical protein